MEKQNKTLTERSGRFRSGYNLFGITIVAVLLCTSLSVFGQGEMPMYRVTIQNLTEGQALTPPLVATHSYGLNLFKVGSKAGAELQAIAENGNNGPMNELLSADARVLGLAESTGGPLVPASNPGQTDFVDSVNLMVAANPSFQFVSWVSMLICSNDGFTGLNSMSLPAGGSRIIFTAGYDAGTEMNTEDFADLVPPCQALIGVTSNKPGTGETNPDLAENGAITFHPGIQGGVDLLPEVHGWKNPVAKVTITAVDGQADRFSAPLSGAGEVPSVHTFASGSAKFRMLKEKQELYYELCVRDISGVTQAHIHNGLPSENGGVVAFLFGMVDPLGLVNGELSSGIISKADLVGDFADDWEGFVAALGNGELYVNVHTQDYPPGEIRGQIGSTAPMDCPLQYTGSMLPASRTASTWLIR